MAYMITHSFPSQSGSIFTKVSKYLKARADHRADRRSYREMLNMSNRELRDIGLTRYDVHEAIMRPMPHPPAQ